MSCELVTQSFLDEIEEILETGKINDKAIGSIWAEAAACLKKHGLMYERLLHTDEVFVHPDNRGKLGLNHHNVHRNIGKIKKGGRRRVETRRCDLFRTILWNCDERQTSEI